MNVILFISINIVSIRYTILNNHQIQKMLTIFLITIAFHF